MNEAANPAGVNETVDQTIVSARTDSPSAPVDDGVHLLVLDADGQAGLRIELGADPVTLGRADSADVKLADPRISKQHCRVSVAQGQVQVIDLASTNGTLVDRTRVQGAALLPVGGRLQVGDLVFRHEVRSRREMQQSKALATDLQKACAYVQALLPPPWPTGPVRVDWCFIPCSILGGDVFGYHNLDENRLAFYLLDVCGHGAGAAMHSVSAINVLRQQALPAVDFAQPEQVLRGLNQAFDMDQHNGLYFTIWYGVYHRADRLLRYASAGHPPAILVGPPRRAALPLQTRSLAVGTMPHTRFQAAETVVAAGSALYIFSDGVYEIVTREGQEWNWDGFRDLVLADRVAGLPESVRLQQAIVARSQTPELADDFSLLVAEFD